MQLETKLADRDRWSAIGRCPIEKAMKIVGSRNAMLTMREAFYNTTRFDDFAERVGMTPATTSANLRMLTEAGLLTRQPYRDEGSRTRNEYLLTQAGLDLMPVVLGLFEWGRRYASYGPSVELVHVDCGEMIEQHISCHAGHSITSDEVELRLA